VSDVSHELRTPLNPVLLIVSDEERNQQLPAEVRGDFETIKKNIELEARLIDDLLDLTAIVRGKLVLQRRVVTLNSIVADALGKVEADAANRMVTLKVRFDQSNPMIDGDAVRIQQALWNVIRNAVKFSPDGGVVTISTQASPASGMVGVTITDGGIGMSREELTRIFEPFAQGDHAAGRGSHRFGGLGLGLAIARRVVELHSGRIFATSVGRNQGSTFLIELPLAAPAALPLNASTGGDAKIHAIAAGMGLRVLLVEDHEPTRTALERLLSRRGFRVLSAAAAGEARQVLLNQPPDLLISDIGLPDGSGYTLMEQFRARPGAVGIALTGYGMEADVTRATDAGFMVHITKPVRVDALDKALGSALAALKPS
ncbi:MAG TPA: ATP-binding protein, partial [Opitutus sp.]|nr:ATP-binding protein [Opitutus sp.]